MSHGPNPLPYVREHLDEQQSVSAMLIETHSRELYSHAVTGAPSGSTIILDESNRRTHRKRNTAIIMDTQRKLGIGKVDMALRTAARYHSNE